MHMRSNTTMVCCGDNKNGESDKGRKAFFDTDNDFRIAEYMHFCSKLKLKKEPKEKGKAPAMIVFCSFEQMQMVAVWEKIRGKFKIISIIFIKKVIGTSIKGNMKIVGATNTQLFYIVISYQSSIMAKKTS